MPRPEAFGGLVLALAVMAVPRAARPCSPRMEPWPFDLAGAAVVDGEGTLHLVRRGADTLTWATMEPPWSVSLVRDTLELGGCADARAPRAFARPSGDGIDVLAPCGELVHFSDAGARLVVLPIPADAIAYGRDGARYVVGTTATAVSVWRQTSVDRWTAVASRMDPAYYVTALSLQLVVTDQGLYVADAEAFWHVELPRTVLTKLPFGANGPGAPTVHTRAIAVRADGTVTFAWVQDDLPVGLWDVRAATPAGDDFVVENVVHIERVDYPRLAASDTGDAFVLAQPGRTSSTLTVLVHDGGAWDIDHLGRGPWFAETRAPDPLSALQLVDGGRTLIGGALELRRISYDGEAWQTTALAAIGEVVVGFFYTYKAGACGDVVRDGCAAGASGVWPALGILALALRRRQRT